MKATISQGPDWKYGEGPQPDPENGNGRVDLPPGFSVKDFIPKVEPAGPAKSDLASTEELGTQRTERRASMLRFNQGKPRMSLIPASLGRYLAAVLGYGAIKYDANNWRKGGSWSENYESLQRHLDAFREGEDIDPESGLPHLAHAAFGVMILTEFYDKGLGTDDRFRYPGQPAGTQLPGRVLEFREPPRREQAAHGPGTVSGDESSAEPIAG